MAFSYNTQHVLLSCQPGSRVSGCYLILTSMYFTRKLPKVKQAFALPDEAPGTGLPLDQLLSSAKRGRLTPPPSQAQESRTQRGNPGVLLTLAKAQHFTLLGDCFDRQSQAL